MKKFIIAMAAITAAFTMVSCEKEQIIGPDGSINAGDGSISAGDCIITASETERCDLIIIGSHGFTGLSRLFAASNSVADRADIPVLIIK